MPNSTGALYKQLMDKVRVDLAGRIPDTVTFVWMQGERDSTEGHGSVYERSLNQLLGQLETDFDRTDIHVVLGRLSDFDSPNYPDWDQVRQAQMDFADAHTNRRWVDTDDLNGRRDDLHYTDEGYDILGSRLSTAAAELLAH